MDGNVLEWCIDAWDPEDGVGGRLSTTERVLRGGAWNLYSSVFDNLFRGYGRPDYRNNYIGFRVCLVLPMSTSNVGEADH